MENSRVGKVQTVQGLIEPSEVGATITHEHLLIDFIPVLEQLPGASNLKRMNEPVSMENLWWVRHYWNSSIDNLRLLDVDVATEEAGEFYNAGGSTIVDVTSIGIGRDPLALRRISRGTGLNVVMGGGHYVYLTHGEDIQNAIRRRSRRTASFKTFKLESTATPESKLASSAKSETHGPGKRLRRRP